MTFGWPVHPVPHHVLVPTRSCDCEHRLPVAGYLHRITGCLGSGPFPYQSRVALPRKVVIPWNDVLIGPGCAGSAAAAGLGEAGRVGVAAGGEEGALEAATVLAGLGFLAAVGRSNPVLQATAAPAASTTTSPSDPTNQARDLRRARCLASNRSTRVCVGSGSVNMGRQGRGT